jgi:hypothetical protein
MFHRKCPVLSDHPMREPGDRFGPTAAVAPSPIPAVRHDRRSAHYAQRRLRADGVGANGVFCKFRPSFRRFGLTANRGKLCRQPPHSHSIVSDTYKPLKLIDLLAGYAELTVTSTAKTFRLGAIDGDRSRMPQRPLHSRPAGWSQFLYGGADEAIGYGRRSSANDHVNA